MYGLDNRNLTAKDRLTLLTQSQIKKANGHSEGELKHYAESFEQVKDLAGIGGDFCAMLGRFGYALTLLILVIHWGIK